MLLRRDFNENNNEKNKKVNQMTLSRLFITEKSMYSWAQQTRSALASKQDLVVRAYSKNHEILNSWVFKNSAPLSWSMEKAEGKSQTYFETLNVQYSH